MTDPSSLRRRIAHAIHRYDNHHALSGNDTPSEHHLGEADFVLAELRTELDALAALRAVARGYCPACGRGDAAPTVQDWERERQRAEQAEAAIARVREIHRPASDWSWKPLGCQHGGKHDAPCRGCYGKCWPCPTIQALDALPAAHDAGPSVAECARNDRLWPLQKDGE